MILCQLAPTTASGTMRAIDLYCGCGGFSLGAHQAGFDVLAAFDIDPVLTSSFARNFPSTTLHLRDLATLTGDQINELVGQDIDLIFGGPPCQGFSSIGLRDAGDPRRTLLGHFFRIVSEVRPRAFVMENVTGLDHQGARQVLNAGLEMVAQGYEILGPLILDAANYGAATKRKRLFVIGYDPSRCSPISENDIAAWTSSPSTVEDAIIDLVGADFVRNEDGFEIWKRRRSDAVSGYASRLAEDDGLFTECRKTVHTAEVRERFSKVEQGGMDSIGRHPRLSWAGQCPTLRAGTGADRGSYQSVRPIHPSESRVITVREAARLQGFPDKHRFHSTVWHSFRMIGNSVSPVIAKAILSAMSAGLSDAQTEAAE
jgi:DNA (cytosine-5)-methyltransferase 1